MSADVFDPNAPDTDGGSRSQYISKKDIKVLGIALVVLGLILWPVYLAMLGQSQKSRCITNLGALYKAMGMYAAMHDDRLPPVYQTSSDGITPAYDAKGMPWTFISDVSSFMNPRASLACPTAEKTELVPTETPSGKSVASSYGMYLPYGAFLPSEIPDPSRTILLAETSNNGAEGSLDPLPFKLDGFVIGWNNSNEAPNKETTSVTRLAFRDAGTAHASGRHSGRVHAVTANGQLVQLKPQDAKVTIQNSTGLPTGIWAVP